MEFFHTTREGKDVFYDKRYLTCEEFKHILENHRFDNYDHNCIALISKFCYEERWYHIDVYLEEGNAIQEEHISYELGFKIVLLDLSQEQNNVLENLILERLD